MPPHDFPPYSSAQAAKSILKTDYADGMSVDDALKLSVKVLGKTMDTTSPSAEKMEFTVLRRCAIATRCHTIMLRTLAADPAGRVPPFVCSRYAQGG